LNLLRRDTYLVELCNPEAKVEKGETCLKPNDDPL